MSNHHCRMRGRVRTAWPFGFGIFAASLVVGVTGCGIFGGGKTASPEMTSPRAVPGDETTKLRLVAGADLNNCGDGPANALGVRVYQLAGTAIDGVPQASLWENDEAELGEELLDRQEFFLDPGQEQEIELTLARNAGFLAVVGNYCRTDGECWRWIQAVDEVKGETVIKFGASCLGPAR